MKRNSINTKFLTTQEGNFLASSFAKYIFTICSGMGDSSDDVSS